MEENNSYSKLAIITWSSAGGADGSAIGGADGILGIDGCNGCVVSNKQNEALVKQRKENMRYESKQNNPHKFCEKRWRLIHMTQKPNN